MKMSSQLHAPDGLPQEKNPSTYSGGCVGPRAELEGLGKQEISCSCRDSNPGTPNPYLVTIPTILARFRHQDSEINYGLQTNTYNNRRLMTKALLAWGR